MKFKILLPVILLLAAAIAVSGCVTNAGDNSETDPIIGTFTFTEPIHADFLPEHSEGVMAAPTCIFYPEGLGLLMWTDENGESLPSQFFFWENSRKSQYHLSIMNGKETIYTKDFKLSDDGTELLLSNPGKTGKFERISNHTKMSSTTENDPIVGTYESDTPIITMFSDDDMVIPTLSFSQNGLGIEYWVSEEGDVLPSSIFFWKNSEGNMYHIVILNPDASLFETDLERSEDGNELKLIPNTNGDTFIKIKIDAIDPIVGTYESDTPITTLFSGGNRAIPTFIFYQNGEGIETWVNEEGDVLPSSILFWKNYEGNRYHVAILNPDASLFETDLERSEDGNELKLIPNTNGDTFTKRGVNNANSFR